jgi:hypothetical protein
MAGFIENEARYEAAKQARIKNNARVGRSRRWFAAHADAQRLSDWLNENGEFAMQEVEPGIWKRHPAAPRGEFYGNMTENLREWGGLTDGQTEAVRKGLQKALDRVAGLDAELEARKVRDAASQHVGVEGQRGEFEAVVEFSISYNTQFGVGYVVGLRDANGNILIIKGSRSLGVVKGQQIKFAAFVKAHGEREGVKQTILNRVKIKQVVGE